MKNIPDEIIIESILNGNVTDFTLLVNRYKDKAFSLLSSMLKNKMDAEEALQDSFLKTFRSLKDFKNKSKFSTWFYKIVYNTGLTVATNKNRKIQLQMNSIDEMYKLEYEDNKDFSIQNRKDFLFTIIDKLPIRNALVLILFYMDNLSLKEISEVLSISLPNTKVLLYRSRNMLREFIIKHNYQEEIL